MKRKNYLILGILILVCMPIYTGSSEDKMDRTLVSNTILSSHYDKTISPGSSWYAIWEISGKFDIDISYSTTGNDITFYFVTKANWEKWMNRESFYYIDKDEDVYAGGYSGRFSDGTWYLIFDNRDSLFHTTTLSLDIVSNIVNEPTYVTPDPYIPPDPDTTYTTTRPTTNTDYIYLLLTNPWVWFIGIICVVGLVYNVRKGKKVEKPVKVIPELTISKDAKVLVICPYCGSKTEQGITKCQKCGADL